MLKSRFSQFCGIFWSFFRCASANPFIDTLFFWYIKGVQVVHIWHKFHLCLICSSRVLKFQMFSYQLKVQFQPASGRSFGCSPLKCGQIHLKFWPVMQCNIMHQTCDNFHFILKKAWNWSRKTIFWLILRGFWFTTFYVLWVTPQSLAKLNTLWRYIIVVRFISVAFVVVEL